MKNFFNLVKTEKKKLYWLHCQIFYFFACFIKLIRQLYFCLIKGLIDNLAIGGAESKKREVAIGFSG